MRGRKNDLLRAVNFRRELCEVCSQGPAQKHMTFPLDLMFCTVCFMQYQKNAKPDTVIEVTTIDRNTVHSKEN